MDWKRALVLVLMTCHLGSSSRCAFAQADRFSPRVESLCGQLTLDEKLALTAGVRDPVDGGQAGYSRGVPRLGIPALRWVDGPGGIDNRYDATSLPSVLSVASTFDPAASAQVGDVLGLEARATRMDVFLGPMVNIARVPSWGRNVTSFGEDPLLTAQMAPPMIKAIEERGVMTTTKHFVANNQTLFVNGPTKEIPGADFVVDERAMHEIYLPGFEAALAAGTSGVMAAYNRINGPNSADSEAMLTGVLRREFGWNGFVVSDWGAVHTMDSLRAGLDVEMPGETIVADGLPYYFGSTLGAAIREGRVPESTLDKAVKRILTQMERKGMLDGTRVVAPDRIDVEGDARIARAVSTEGAVLLKNDSILPLKPDALRSIAVIGPNAGQLAPSQGFGAAVGIESRRVSPLDALRNSIAAGPAIRFAVGDDLAGTAIPSSALRVDDGKSEGLTRTGSDGIAKIIDPQIDFAGSKALPVGRSCTWTGLLRVPESGEYLINTQSWGGSTRLKIDGRQVAKSAMAPLSFGVPKRTTSLLPTPDGLDNGQASLHLEANRSYKLELHAEGRPDSRLQVRLAWVTPSMRRSQIAEAVAVARDADTAIVFAWQRGGEFATNGEDLALPNQQDALIEAVAAVNPNTIVVLNTAGPVAMPWKSKVKGILEMWFPGQEGGWATADILLGAANPGGRLPITFPARSQDSPAFAPGHPERYAGTRPDAGPANRIIYSEGIFVGYRYFDENKIEPLFPFGFGLSYTSFAYSDLKTWSDEQGVRVSFAVRNSGALPGAEVAQVYLGRPEPSSVLMAPKVLAAFKRLTLAPGESQTVTVQIANRQLGYWSTESHGWVPARGRRTVLVGASSRDVRLEGSFEIAAP